LLVVHDPVYVPLPAPRFVNPGVSRVVGAVLIRALAKKPEDRYPTLTLCWMPSGPRRAAGRDRLRRDAVARSAPGRRGSCTALQLRG